MALEEFIRILDEEIETEKDEKLTADTAFRELANWSSMLALIIIARIDDEYDVKITAKELAGAITLNDLFELVRSKHAA